MKLHFNNLDIFTLIQIQEYLGDEEDYSPDYNSEFYVYNNTIFQSNKSWSLPSSLSSSLCLQ